MPSTEGVRIKNGMSNNLVRLYVDEGKLTLKALLKHDQPQISPCSVNASLKMWSQELET